METYTKWLGVVVIVGIVFAIGLLYGQSTTDEVVSPFGSVSISNEYFATSTAAGSGYGGFSLSEKLFKTGSGSLGSVIITGANTGVLNFYNATTSNVDKRTGNVASSTILLASIPVSTVAGTYTFDALYNVGLLMVLESGLIPTSTITWR